MQPFDHLMDQDFVALTTYKRSKDPVTSAMWVARHGAELVMFTHADSAKVKRLNRNAEVLLTPCSRRGRIAVGAVPKLAVCRVDRDPAMVSAVKQCLQDKYGWQFSAMMAAERVLSRGNKPRVALILSPRAQSDTD